MDDTPARRTLGISALNVLFGVWLMLAPFLLAYNDRVAGTNDFVVGMAVILFALVQSLSVSKGGWSWANLLLGFWLVIAPFALAYIDPAARWNDLIVGVLVMIVAWFSALSRVPGRSA